MSKQYKVKIAIIVILASVITAFAGNIISKSHTIDLIDETVVYGLYMAAREIDLCCSDETENISYQLIQAALSMQKSHSQLESDLASSFGIDSRVSFDGNMNYVSCFILTGGTVNGSYVRPASQIDRQMSGAERTFYTALSETIKSVAYRKIVFDKDGMIGGFVGFNAYSINNLALEFQKACSSLFTN